MICCNYYAQAAALGQSKLSGPVRCFVTKYVLTADVTSCAVLKCAPECSLRLNQINHAHEPCRMTQLLNFQPHPWLRNQHVQTLWSRIARYKARSERHWQCLPLPDGDFIDLAWNRPYTEVKTEPKRPLLIIFHGLEGSVYSPYADDLMATALSRGWHAVVMHFRGCSGRPNRSHRAYHSGDTADASTLVAWLQRQGFEQLYAAGFSLGGNMLVKLLGEEPDIGLRAAVSTSAPLSLGPSSARIDQGFSRVYRNHLVGSLKRKIIQKHALGQLQGHLHIDPATIRRIVNFRTFDNLVTAPLHGFDGADDYYTRCSGLQFIPLIRRPLLIIHAADDPFTSPCCVPEAAMLPANVRHELSTHGGHVGFVAKHEGKPGYWLSRRILDFLSTDISA